MKLKQKTNRLVMKAVMGVALATASSSLSSAAEPASTEVSTSPLSSLNESATKWWKGSGAFNDWFGLGLTMKDYGLTITGSSKEIFYGQISGGLPNQPKANWVNEEKIKFSYDFSRVFNIPGLTFESEWRYRSDNGSEYNPYTAFAAGTSGPSSIFNPSDAVSGMGLRIMPQQLEWKSDSSKTPLFTINAGWENPYQQFLQQPLSKLFENNAIASAKGIGGQVGAGIYVVNDVSAKGAKGAPTKSSARSYATQPVPWSSSYASWGGTIKIRPTSETYIQSGLYLAMSGASGVNESQYTATGVYPYTSVPSSYLGKFKRNGQTLPEVGSNGKLTGKYQNSGYVASPKNNHGFNFRGAQQFSPNRSQIGKTPTGKSSSGATSSNATYDPYDAGSNGVYQENGLFSVTEIGWEPKFGPDKLEGKYVLGGYIWEQDNTSFQPVKFSKAEGSYTETYNGKKPTPTKVNPIVWGLYVQADQRLYAVRDPNPASPSKAITKKGLYMINMATFTPPENNALPFYFQTGLVYEGLLPTRDADKCGIAFGCGFYSSEYNDYIDSQNKALYNQYGSRYNGTVPNGPDNQKPPNANTGVPGSSKAYFQYAPHFTSTQVLEAFYQVQINKWATFKPFVQYIINPAGNGTVPNDCILGANLAVKF